MQGIPEPRPSKNSKNNTILRAEFNHIFSLFTLYAFDVKNISFIITDYYRSAIQQNKRFNEGLSLCDGYKKLSLHQRWRAKDIMVIDERGRLIRIHAPQYDVLAEIWKSLGGRWGGDWFIEGKTAFDDCFHFEY